MWSLLAPLGKPSRFSSIVCNYWKCTTYRQSSQPAGRRPVNRRPWTEEDDVKLRSLYQQGFRTTRIVSEMSDLSAGAIEWRLALMRAKPKPPRLESERATHHLWTAEEVALMLEKRRQGLPIHDIASYFPDRGYSAVKKHVHRVTSWPVSRRGFEEFTEEDVQRVVEMRMKEDKTYGEIASELNCSTNTVEYVWRSRCRNLVSDEVRESIRRHRRWSPNEEQHLLELQRRGSISIPDAARQFPSKTEGAVRIKIMRERLEFPMLKRGPKKRM